MLSRKPPITLWKSCFSSRYSRYPVSRMPSVVRARNVTARRDASRRQRGRPSRATTIVVGASNSDVPPTTHHQFRDVALEEHLHGPVEDRTQPRRQSGQLEHVDDLPHHPGGNAAQFQTEQIGHRSVPAQRHHLGVLSNGKGALGPSGQLRFDHRSERASLRTAAWAVATEVPPVWGVTWAALSPSAFTAGNSSNSE